MVNCDYRKAQMFSVLGFVSSGTLMLQLDGFPTGDGVQVRPASQSPPSAFTLQQSGERLVSTSFTPVRIIYSIDDMSRDPFDLDRKISSGIVENVILFNR